MISENQCLHDKWKDLQKIFMQTDNLLKQTTACVNFLSSQKNLDFVNTRHYKKRKKERNITNRQALYVMKNGEAVALEKSTRQGFCKVRICGKDFDEKEITVVIIPGLQVVKLITCF